MTATASDDGGSRADHGDHHHRPRHRHGHHGGSGASGAHGGSGASGSDGDDGGSGASGSHGHHGGSGASGSHGHHGGASGATGPHGHHGGGSGASGSHRPHHRGGSGDGGGGKPGGGNSGGGSPKGGPKGGGGSPSGGGKPNGGGGSNGGGNPNGGGNQNGGGSKSLAPRGDTVHVDPPALIDKGKKLADLPSAANGLFDVLKKLNNTLHSLGQPWGGDELGKQFAEGASGYLSAVESLVGNASTGPDASGAIPVYGQLLVNYGKTIQEAGKAFGLGEDLYAEWILKSYIDENAHGNPGKYTGPLSSDPNFGKDGGKPTGPPVNTKYQGSGGGGSSNSGGSNSGGSSPGGSNPGGQNPGGSNPDGSNPTGPNAGDVTGPTGPSTANHALTSSTGSPSLAALDSGTGPVSSSNPFNLSTTPGAPLTDTSLDPGVNALPGAIGPNGYVPGSGPAGVGPQANPGGPGTMPGGTPGPRTTTESAFEGERLAPKTVPGGVPSRAAVSSGGMMPSTPSMPGAGAGGAAADGKEKRRGERRKPVPPADDGEGASGADDPWQRSGWPVGGR